MIEKYNKAVEQYNQTFEMLDNLGKTFEKFFAKKGKEFSGDVFVKQFDCVLQYALLEFALADGEICENEISFIKNLTKKGDLVTYINSYYKTSISWNDILNAKSSSVAKWIKVNKEYVDKIAEQFTDAFAFADSALDEDLFTKLNDSVVAIFVMLSFMDGDSSEAEKKAIRENYIVKFFASIQLKINEFDKE